MRTLFLLLLTCLAPFAANAADGCPSAGLGAISLPHVRATLARNHELLIVAFGSSTTVSWMASNIGHSYPAILQDNLNERFPAAHIAVINRGVGGQSAAQELARLATDVLPIHPQLVIWQVGGNDVLRQVDPAAFSSALTAGVVQLQQAGIDVVLMDNQRSPRILAVSEHAAIDHALADVAERTGAALFARGTLMDEWQRQGYPYASFVAPDRLHHNDRGYRCIADALARSIVAGLGAHGAREAMQVKLTRGG